MIFNTDLIVTSAGGYPSGMAKIEWKWTDGKLISGKFEKLLKSLEVGT